MKKKTVFSLINFEILENIFLSSKIELNSQHKILYMNCLYGHFKGKEANKENLSKFDIDVKNLKNYSRWKNNFEHLSKAGLIEINSNVITFLDLWNDTISKDILKIEQKYDQDDIEKQLLENKSMIEVICMKNKIKPDQINHLVKIFVTEQNATESKHRDIGEYTKHFIYWVKNNLDNLEITNQSSVKSKSKLLGL